MITSLSMRASKGQPDFYPCSTEQDITTETVINADPEALEIPEVAPTPLPTSGWALRLVLIQLLEEANSTNRYLDQSRSKALHRYG